MKAKIQKKTGTADRQSINSSWQNSKAKEKNNSPANDARAKMNNVSPLSESQKNLYIKKPNKSMVRKRKYSQQPLRDLRTQKELTLHKLAEITGLSSSYLSRLESGTRRFNVEILQKLAHALSCSVTALLPLESQDLKGASPRGSADYEGNSSGASRFNVPDLPLYRLKSLDDKHSILELDSPTGWINRPHELQGVTGAISFQVHDDFNSQRYRPGDQIFAHPSRPLSPNCSVLAINTDNQAFLGEFIGWSLQKGNSELMILRQYHSPHTKDHSNDDLIHIPNDSMKAVYRVIGLVEVA